MMNKNELFEDGFMGQEKQIKVLNERGLSTSEISDKVGVSEDRVVQIINKSRNKNNLNE